MHDRSGQTTAPEEGFDSLQDGAEFPMVGNTPNSALDEAMGDINLSQVTLLELSHIVTTKTCGQDFFVPSPEPKAIAGAMLASPAWCMRSQKTDPWPQYSQVKETTQPASLSTIEAVLSENPECHRPAIS